MRSLGLGLALVIAMVASAGAEQVTFQSGSYAGFRQLVAREPAASTNTIAGTLSFPDEKRDRYPALVIVHTIGGYQDSNEGWHAARFRKSGFATLTYISPTAQRMAKFAFNLIDDGLIGQQVFAGEATRLAYMTDEAAEGRDAFLEKRTPDFSPFPWYF